jgi:hypothetical protein
MRGRVRRRPVLIRVGHDPAAAPDLITRRGGSRSRREVDPYYAAAEARTRIAMSATTDFWIYRERAVMLGMLGDCSEKHRSASHNDG